MYEKIHLDPIEDAIEAFRRGEMVIVVEGAKEITKEITDEDIKSYLAAALEKMKSKENCIIQLLRLDQYC